MVDTRNPAIANESRVRGAAGFEDKLLSVYYATTKKLSCRWQLNWAMIAKTTRGFYTTVHLLILIPQSSYISN